MARKPKVAGSTEIADAERLFRKSEVKGKPDFRYVALAIGANPHRPPRWAIIECIAARRAIENQPSLEPSRDAGAVLDQIIVEFALHEDEWQTRQLRYQKLKKQGRRILPKQPGQLRQISFAEACRRAWRVCISTKTQPTRKEIERFQKAWNREQVQELADWEVARDLIEARGDLSQEDKVDLQSRHHGMVVSYNNCRGTHRMERVLNKHEAEKFPDDIAAGLRDLPTTIWLYKNLTE